LITLCLTDTRVASEAVAQRGNIVALHTPEGFGTSKLAGHCARDQGDVTGRHLRTIATLVEMLDG